MCVNYTPTRAELLLALTGRAVDAPYPRSAFPGYAAPIVRAVHTDQKTAEIGLEIRVDLASFGLIPAWSKDHLASRRTYNARAETVAEKPSYRSAWRRGQLCLVPMEQFFEPCWDTGKAVRWSIHRRDRQPFCAAAIWDCWTDPSSGEQTESFSLLTINADRHPIMGKFHRPGDEKRSLVVLAQPDWKQWLSASRLQATQLLNALPEDLYAAEPAESELTAGRQPSLI
jgi:putative SOS response-associated peptidase YedK